MKKRKVPLLDGLEKVLVIGSGAIVIGQAAEFDYSGSQCCKAIREEGIEAVLVNSNPATIMTDLEIADTVYIEPITWESIQRIIEKERPDGLIATMGGQTGLNVSCKLSDNGVIEKYGVRVLGTDIESIKKGEDRDEFKKLMRNIGEPMPSSKAVNTIEEAKAFAKEYGYPVIIRPAYTLGGTGGGVAYDEESLEKVAGRGLRLSMNHQVLIEQSVLGWGEIEYEVMRDAANTCITICNMENIDPMGIHTGESMVVAPALTLSDEDNQKMRTASLKIIRALSIKGGCNIQFSFNYDTGGYKVIEVNPRVSRSSALASKATGYPIAKIGTKIALGLNLDEIPNDVTKKTPASFEPSIDYVVTKIPRWAFEKFRGVPRELGTEMRSVGEVMAIGRSFEESLQKAIRSLETKHTGFGFDERIKRYSRVSDETLEEKLKKADDQRLYYLFEALRRGYRVEQIHSMTKINPFFIHKMKKIVDFGKKLSKKGDKNPETILKAKKMGFSDDQLAATLNTSSEKIRVFRKKKKIRPVYKIVDTCAAEFEAVTPYYYSTYETENEAVFSKKPKVAVIGAGPNRIGQGVEFDYCCSHASFALKELGYESIMINCNPETVSTDYDTSTRLYFEPLSLEDVLNVLDQENPAGVIVQYGGQTSINLAVPLAKNGVNILGTPPESIDRAEDRGKWTKLLKKLNIPQPEYGTAYSYEEAKEVAKNIGYPVLVRPSYVLGGRAMDIVFEEKDLESYIKEAVDVAPEHPVLIDKFLDNAVETEVDAIADGKNCTVGGYMEHIEEAGVHSGDAASVLPPQTLSKENIDTMRGYTHAIARELKVKGLINVQFAIQKDKVYVIEANPRASRTVPFVSKTIGRPLAKYATKCMLGQSLEELGFTEEVWPQHVSVKEAVLPFLKMPGYDPVLGPEMKSTGEVMGVDKDFGLAFYKAELSAGTNLPSEPRGKIVVSLTDRDKPRALRSLLKLSSMGYELVCTSGTSEFLEKNGVKNTVVKKVSQGFPNIATLMREGAVDLVLCTPSRGKREQSDGGVIRRTAVELGIPYLSTVEAGKAAVSAIESISKGKIGVNSLNDLY